jgi:hypothetical protein
MVQSGRLHRYTYADYVALEESSPTKHEYYQGEIYSMAGGSEEHSLSPPTIAGGKVTLSSLEAEVVVDESAGQAPSHRRRGRQLPAAASSARQRRATTLRGDCGKLLRV